MACFRYFHNSQNLLSFRLSAVLPADQVESKHKNSFCFYAWSTDVACKDSWLVSQILIRAGRHRMKRQRRRNKTKWAITFNSYGFLFTVSFFFNFQADQVRRRKGWGNRLIFVLYYICRYCRKYISMYVGPKGWTICIARLLLMVGVLVEERNNISISKPQSWKTPKWKSWAIIF